MVFPLKYPFSYGIVSWTKPSGCGTPIADSRQSLGTCDLYELGLGWNHIERMAKQQHGTMVGFYGNWDPITRVYGVCIYIYMYLSMGDTKNAGILW